MDSETELRALVAQTARELSAGPTVAWCAENDFELVPGADFDPETDDADDLDNYEDRPSAYDWLAKAYDVHYVVGADKEYIGAQVMVAGGGPTIWVHTFGREVVGSWWDAPVTVPYADEWGLDDAMRESWDAMK